MVVTSISPNIVCAGSEFVRVTFRWQSRKVIDKLNGIGFISYNLRRHPPTLLIPDPVVPKTLLTRDIQIILYVEGAVVIHTESQYQWV